MAIDLAAIPDWARRPVSRPAGHRPRVVLVGPCAGGKSTLAGALLGDGYDAVALAQEHSEVPHLWALSQPDALIYLAVTLAVIRQRRAAPNWPAAIYQRQLRRLRLALAHATVYIDTDRRQPDGVLAVARAGLLAAGVVVAKDLVADEGRN